MKAKLTFLLVTSLLLTGLCGCFSTKEATAGVVLELEINNSLYELDNSGADFSGALKNTPPRFGEDSATCVRNWSLYSEFFRQRNYKAAIDPWRWMFFNCPMATENIYIHGATLVKFMLTNETDPIRQQALVDTLMMVYDQRIQYYSEKEGFIRGRKAVELYQLRPNAVQEHYELSERSIELEGNSAPGDVLVINFHSTVRLAAAGVIDSTAVVENYDRATDIIQYNLVNNPADSTFYIPARNNIEAFFEPFASCDNLARVFRPRFNNTPEDPELLERITSMLNRSGCTDNELFYLATRNLHRLNPTAQSAFLMGRMETSQKNYNRAIEYFEEAISLYGENGDKFTTYLLMANIMHQHLRRLPQARAYALRASEIRPNDGRPFILIGEMYASSARDCGDNDLTNNVAFWTAVDKFIQARNVDSDPAIRERATQLINTYSQYFPNVETIFFYGLSEGDTYRVECWINETTRVRSR